MVVVRRANVKALGGGRSRYRFTVHRAGTYRVVVLPRDNFAHVRGLYDVLATLRDRYPTVLFENDSCVMAASGELIITVGGA